MLALKYPTPDDQAHAVTPQVRADFHGIRFYKPQCQTQPVARTTQSLPNDHDLIVRLCQMPVDLATPLLRSSLPSLDSTALLALIAATGEAHHLLIAQRPALDWRVVRALIRTGHDSVLTALVRNPGSELDEDDRARLERLAQERPELQQALAERYRRPAAAIDVTTRDSHSNLKLLKLMRNSDVKGFVREAGQRLHIDPVRLELILSVKSAVPLALCFCALGLDRAVFLHLLPFWQQAHDGEPRVTPCHRPVILSLFDLTADAAQKKLAALLHA